ncbi:MAG: hypothetical protein E7458_08470 [Ruminococcaceae bacterium]|nr:hypothetical protein [Oscillospiraceae bacterium]
MSGFFTIEDRQAAFEFIRSTADACSKVVSLVQVGSGAIGYHDEYSDLDFVVALDSDDSMLEVMDYVRKEISAKYELLYFAQNESRHLQVYLLSNFLEIDIGYGGYEHAAANKPAFRVLYDKTGVVEEKMIRSREWMDDVIFGEKQKKDLALAAQSVWMRLMHAAVAIHRGQTLHAMGELDQVRTQYIDLVGDRCRLESALNREMDRLPEAEKAAILSTYLTGADSDALWNCLLTLTERIFNELEGVETPLTRELLQRYYQKLR